MDTLNKIRIWRNNMPEFNAVKLRCPLCRLGMGIGGIRGKVYDETNKYYIADSIAPKWPQTELLIVAILKRHTANPSQAEKDMLEEALRRVMRIKFELMPWEYTIKDFNPDEAAYPKHYHTHGIKLWGEKKDK